MLYFSRNRRWTLIVVQLPSWSVCLWWICFTCLVEPKIYFPCRHFGPCSSTTVLTSGYFRRVHMSHFMVPLVYGCFLYFPSGFMAYDCELPRGTKDSLFTVSAVVCLCKHFIVVNLSGSELLSLHFPSLSSWFPSKCSDSHNFPILVFCQSPPHLNPTIFPPLFTPLI